VDGSPTISIFKVPPDLGLAEAAGDVVVTVEDAGVCIGLAVATWLEVGGEVVDVVPAGVDAVPQPTSTNEMTNSIISGIDNFFIPSPPCNFLVF